MTLQSVPTSVLHSLFDANYTATRKARLTGQALKVALDSNKALAAENARLKSQFATLAQDAKRRKPKVLRPVHASVGLECEYRRRLHCLIEEMDASVQYWLRSAYRGNEPHLRELQEQDLELAQDVITITYENPDVPAALAPGSMVDEASGHWVQEVEPPGELSRAATTLNAKTYSGVPVRSRDRQTPPLALDALPANILRRAVRKLARRWQRKFNEAAGSLAVWFAQSNGRRSKERLKKILRDGGWSVELQLSQAQRDVLQSVVHENVGLIRSIPQQYFTQVEGMVMRSVQTGRDLHQLTKDLQRQFGVTKRRAHLIARDQNAKATEALTRVRHLELGITKAVWVHSHAGKVPRRTHLANDGNTYDVRRGWYDPDPKVRKLIHPGFLINCRCFSRAVIPGLT